MRPIWAVWSDKAFIDVRQLFFQTVSYLHALSQLCHCDTHLAHDTWLQLFPRVWKVLSERMQHVS